MQALVDISMYPLDKEYETPILDFIQRIRGRETLEVNVGDTSTTIRGEYTEIMQAITVEMEASFLQPGRAVFVLKVLNFE